MKLVLIMGAKQFDNEIKQIFADAEIAIYGQTDISGHNKNEEENFQDNWFALSNENQKSNVFFLLPKKIEQIKH